MTSVLEMPCDLDASRRLLTPHAGRTRINASCACYCCAVRQRRRTVSWWADFMVIKLKPHFSKIKSGCEVQWQNQDRAQLPTCSAGSLYACTSTDPVP
ncbi:hypothetical protein PC128_g3732 [Phytophthora cactorum]|nr:hypothetical protein PC120_g26891 [Phytophthora cactorum]KAG3201693.1 hypothetical protein PC128_g3732 [Phytophthora cactorum]